MVFDLVHEYVHYRNNQREEKRKLMGIGKG